MPFLQPFHLWNFDTLVHLNGMYLQGDILSFMIEKLACAYHKYLFLSSIS
jgi:hypothetical protein